METSSESFSEITKLLGTPIYGTEARSKQFCKRCNTAGLEQNVCFRIPTFYLDRSGDKQGSLGKCKNNDTRDTHTVETTLVYSPTKNVHTMPIAFTITVKPITKSLGSKTSSCENQVPKVSGVENYRKTLEMEGISSNAGKLISMSRRPASIAGYGLEQADCLVLQTTNRSILYTFK